MKSNYLPSTGECRSSIVSVIFRVFTLSLFIAAFGYTQLQAQVVAYVAAAPGNNSVSVISTATNTITATISLPTSPFALAASPDGTALYVADLVLDENQQPVGTGNLYVIDTSTNTLVRNIPVSTGEFLTGLAITPDGKTLYASAAITGNVDVMDIATGNVTASLPGIGFSSIVVSPDGTTVYANFDQGPTFISAISTANNTVAATIPFDDFDFPGLAQMALTPDGSFLYVPLHGPDTVAVVATATNTIVGPQIAVGGSPGALGISPNGAFAYVANTGGNSVSVIDIPTNTVVATIPTTDFGPVYVAFTPDSFFAYISDENGTVDVISTTTQAIVASIPFGAGIAEMVIVNLPTPPTIAAQGLIQGAINHIAAMSASNFDAIGHQTSLINQLQQTIVDIQQGRGAQAIGKLTDAITRTDGFPLRGALDTNGPGIDWITDQADQNFVYQALTDALKLLTAS